MPRKSNVSQVSAAGEEGTPSKELSELVSIDDLSLPRTMVQRLAKGVLPPNTQIQKDAVTAMSKGATVFVSHIADKANDLTLSTSRKTISPKAVLDALRECEYADFLPRVEAELARFSEIATGKRNEYRRKIKEKETGVAGGGYANAGEGVGGPGEKNVLVGVHVQRNGEVRTEADGEERANKRTRTEEGLDGSRVQMGAVETAPALQGADTTMEEEDDDAAEVEQQFEREEEVAEHEEDEEDEESEEESVDENGEAGSASSMDVDARMRAGRDGLSSGVDDSDSEEGSD